MATLVTGGTGFIGVNVVRELAAHGHAVVSIDVGPPDALTHRFLEPWRERVTWVTGDVLDGALLERVAADHPIERIVHAAAYTPYGDQEQTHFRFCVDNNLGSTLALLELATRQGARRLLFVSTVAVYQREYQGDSGAGKVFAEDAPLAPSHVYGITKVAGEGLVRRYGRLFGLEVASLRLAQNWGPMERVTPYHARMAIPYMWVRQAVRGEPITPSPFGVGVTEGRCLNQDHPYVLDTAAAIRAVLEAPRLSFTEYNVSTGVPVFLDDLVAAMREAEPEVRFVEPIPRDNASTRAGLSQDCGRLRHDTGFTCRYTLASALADCIAWRREVGFFD